MTSVAASVVTPPASISPPARRPTTSRTALPLSPEQASSMIDVCDFSHRLLAIHASILRSGLSDHPIIAFKLQRRYSSLGQLDRSLDVLRSTPQPNVFSWTAAIHAHATNDDHRYSRRALLLYTQMLSSSVLPNAFTFSAVLRVCNLADGKPLHSHVLKLGLAADPYVCTAMIDLYARGGDAISARNVFDRIPETTIVNTSAMVGSYAKNGELQRALQLFYEMGDRDTVCWNSMIGGYVQHGRSEEALALFMEMLRSPSSPDEVTVVTVLSACAQMGALDSGRWIHSYAQNNGIKLNTQVRTSLIDMYCKSGSLEEACQLFDTMTHRDIVAWNSMINGYAMHGRGREAVDLFDQLCRLGLHPTDITFIGVLNACSHAGLLAEGRAIFADIEKVHGMKPKIEHLGCMVDLLGRTGLVEEAFKLVQTTKVAADPVLLGSLLASCRLHKKKELGVEIAQYLIANKLANSGTFVLLSNIYASDGKWNEVASVRSLMADIGVEREAGRSSVEIDSKVHNFVAGDTKHPSSAEIYAKMEEMKEMLRARGYVPLTEAVAHDLEEREKERQLGVHSEKLAMAFALIASPPGTTIRVVKNLRICVDCHTVAKMVSEIAGRKIVMRDRNRFHHFAGGSCSCGDFW